MTSLTIAITVLIASLLIWGLLALLAYRAVRGEQERLTALQQVPHQDDPKTRWKKLREEGNEEYIEAMMRSTRQRKIQRRPSRLGLWLSRAGIQNSSELIGFLVLASSVILALSLAIALAVYISLGQEMSLMAATLAVHLGALGALLVLRSRKRTFENRLLVELPLFIEQLICVTVGGIPMEQGVEKLLEINQALGFSQCLEPLLIEALSVKEQPFSGGLVKVSGERRLSDLWHIAKVLERSEQYASERTKQLRELKQKAIEQLELNPIRRYGSANTRRYEIIQRDFTVFLSNFKAALASGDEPFTILARQKDYLDIESDLSLAIQYFEEQVKSGISQDLALIASAQALDFHPWSLFSMAMLFSKGVGGRMKNMLDELLAEQERESQVLEAPR